MSHLHKAAEEVERKCNSSFENKTEAPATAGERFNEGVAKYHQVVGHLVTAAVVTGRPQDPHPGGDKPIIYLHPTLRPKESWHESPAGLVRGSGGCTGDQ
ncbi:hypothetical protein EYF80_007035 [Liparis tanakae]|uniref:Uncharacterized protein n=1 Tax=Liparis tanakae TaxID=230148 RepID=A0A4Z2IZ16_9TELE|nr:hypothetical protein EYF80_007035 [Liparis tanakae]